MLHQHCSRLVRIRQRNHLVRFRETWFGIKNMIVCRRESVGRSFLMLSLPLHVATWLNSARFICGTRCPSWFSFHCRLDFSNWSSWRHRMKLLRHRVRLNKDAEGMFVTSRKTDFIFRKGWMQRKKKLQEENGRVWETLRQSADDVTTGCSVSHNWKFYPTNQRCAVFLFHCLVSAQLALNLNQVMTIANGRTRAEWFQASHTICLKWGLVSDWSGAADCWFDFLKQPQRQVHRHAAGSNNTIIIEHHSHRVLAALHPF